MDTARNTVQYPFRVAISTSKESKDGKGEVWSSDSNYICALQEQGQYWVTVSASFKEQHDLHLYMPELDIPIPEKDKGKYPAPADQKNSEESPGEFCIFKYESENKYEPLRVGTYSAKVICDGKEYLFPIKVVPNMVFWSPKTRNDILNCPRYEDKPNSQCAYSSEDAENSWCPYDCEGARQLWWPNYSGSQYWRLCPYSAREKWQVMLDEVEQEAWGLAQDLVRRSLGLEDEAANALTAEKLYRFLIIRQYSSRVLGALLGIQNAPKNRILTQYVALPEGKSCKADAKSMRITAVSGERKRCVFALRKEISYDIPENRLLKKIITFYDRELSDFYARIQKSVEFRKANKNSPELHYETRQHIEAMKQNLECLKKDVGRLRQISGVIKSRPWYDQIQNVPDVEPNHAVAMDPRYSVLLQMYQAMKQEIIRCRENAKLDFSWKPSSDIYEMWCFLKVYHAFRDSDENWNWDISEKGLALDSNTLFPSLEPGTSIRFTNAKYQLNGQTHSLAVELIYNREVGVNSTNDGDPFYYATKDEKAHKLPDIRLDLYESFGGVPQKYYGTLILECKYRSTGSFWDGNSSQSSFEQIQFYYSNSRTKYSYIPPQSNPQRSPFMTVKPCPVKRVIVLTPDTKPPSDAVPGFVEFLPLKPGLESPSTDRPVDILKIVQKQFIDEQLRMGYYIEDKKTQQ